MHRLRCAPFEESAGATTFRSSDGTTLAPAGAVWGVNDAALPIKPSETLTLTVDDTYYYAAFSSPLDELLAGDVVYVQVDFASADSAHGAVLELHEQLGRSYNNVSGPHGAGN